MDFGFDLATTVLLGMLAVSAPSVLSIVLFRVMVKEGFPLDSQVFRRECLMYSLLWLGLFFLNLFLLLVVGNASMTARLQEVSGTFVVSLICALGTFSLSFLLRKKLYRESPDFIPTFFLLVISLCFSLLILKHLDLGMKRAQRFMDEGHSTTSLNNYDLCQDPSLRSGCLGSRVPTRLAEFSDQASPADSETSLIQPT